MIGPRYHGKAAFDAAIVATIGAALQRQWDPDGALLLAATTRDGDDTTVPRTYGDFALAIAGLLAAGGTEAEVSGYLRREEERLLGAAHCATLLPNAPLFPHRERWRAQDPTGP